MAGPSRYNLAPAQDRGCTGELRLSPSLENPRPKCGAYGLPTRAAFTGPPPRVLQEAGAGRSFSSTRRCFSGRPQGISAVSTVMVWKTCSTFWITFLLGVETGRWRSARMRRVPPYIAQAPVVAEVSEDPILPPEIEDGEQLCSEAEPCRSSGLLPSSRSIRTAPCCEGVLVSPGPPSEALAIPPQHVS